MNQTDIITKLRKLLPGVKVSTETHTKFKKDYDVYVFNIGHTEIYIHTNDIKTDNDIMGVVKKIGSALYL